MVSCQKDISTNGILLPVKSLYDSQKFPEPNTESKADEERIVEFSNLLKKLGESTSSFSPNSSEMPIHETVWNVEALLNASYASAGEPFSQNNVKKDSLLVALNANGAIDQSSLPTVYEAMRVKLADQYQSVTGVNKHLVYVDIEFKGTKTTTNFGPSIVMANFELTSFTGYGYPPEDIPFTVGDNWMWDKSSGRCNLTTGAPNGLNIGEGAATILTKQLNIRYPKFDTRYYFIDIQTLAEYVDYSRNRTPNDVLDNRRDYLIYEVTNELPLDNPGFEFAKALCINFDDMNWYYQNYFNKITQNLSLFPTKSFVSIKVEIDGHAHIDPNTGANHSVLLHRLKTTYGKYHYSVCPIVCSCTDGTCVPDPNCFQSQ